MSDDRPERRDTWIRQARDFIRVVPDLVQFLPLALTILPERYQWTLHNIVGHPVGEILSQVGLKDLGNRVHDITVPAPKDEDMDR